MKVAQLFLIVCISGLIGYVTNVLAIKSLFRPLYPKKLGPFTLQGLIPKRRNEVATSIGTMVANELLSEDDLVSQIISDRDEEKFRNVLTRWVEAAAMEKINFLPKMIQDRLLLGLDDKIERESPKIFAQVKLMVEDHIRTKVDIAGLIEEKINELDLEMLEKLTLQIASKELRAIEWLGLVMGMGIGLLQGLITIYWI